MFERVKDQRKREGWRTIKFCFRIVSCGYTVFSASMIQSSQHLPPFVLLFAPESLTTRERECVRVLLSVCVLVLILCMFLEGLLNFCLKNARVSLCVCSIQSCFEAIAQE